MSLLTELKRRNVFRVAVAYAVIAWVLAQVADLAFDNFGTPEWVGKTVLFILVLGFPLAIFFAWAFEMTPEGVKKEKDVDRSQSITHQTGRKLEFLIVGMLVVAIGWLLVDKFVLQEESSDSVAQTSGDVVTEKSVAVLPFVAMSSGPDDEYFADGLTEEILNSLARLPELLVTARTSAFAFKGLDTSVPEIADKLGVAHVVEGSVRRSGEQLRITAQLIRASDGFHLWSETYDRSSADSFGVQGEIAEKVAAALDVVLDQEQLAKMRTSGLRNPEAFIAFQKGAEAAALAHENTAQGQIDGLAVANQFFERVIELEPDFSAAHFDHGDYFIHFAIGSAEIANDAEAVARAIELANQDFTNAARTAETEGDRLNAALEQTLISGSWWRMPELLSAAARTSDCFSPSWWGAVPSILDPSDDALTIWQRTHACDPLNFYAWVNLSRTQFARGDFQSALDTALRGMETVPHRQIVDELFMAYLALGRTEEARATSLRHIDEEDRLLLHRMTLASAKGDVVEARELRDQILQQFGTDLFGVWQHAMLGEYAQANQLAAEWDARPLGFLELLDQIGTCVCGAPFDLEVTPNFARLIGEANLPWPPPSPINWPLKDW
jgi:TolB-like protein